MTASVYLCGFMGCGKSHIGRLLAAELGRELVDLDKVIVDREGMSIPEIFEKFGEPHFRSLEAKYIRELSGGYIVATGGGSAHQRQDRRIRTGKRDLRVHKHSV